MSNILLFTSYFPPDQHIGASRWARLIPYLVKAGHRFYVVSQDNAKYIGQDQKLLLKPLKVYRIPFNSFSRFKVNILRRGDGNIVANSDHITNKAKKRTLWKVMDGCFFSKLNKLINILIVIADFPHYSKWWGTKAIPVALNIIEREGIDLIISTHPLMTCNLVAKKVSKVSGIPWIADMRDPWAEDPQSFFRDDGIFHKILKKMEKDCLSSASEVVTINKNLANLLLTEHEKVNIIPNAFNPDEYSSLINQNLIDDNPIHIVYAGSIYDNHMYRNFLEGLKIIRTNIKKKFIIEYYGNKFKRLLISAKDIGIDNSLFLNHGMVSRKSLLKKLCDSDFLLLFGWMGKNEDCVVTGKIFDYLGTNRPIITISKRQGAMAELINQTGAGKVLPTPQDVARFFKQLIDDPDKTQKELLKKRNNEEIKKYTIHYTSNQYLSIINKLT